MRVPTGWQQSTDVLVLCYHAVSPTWDAALSVTPDALERQLTWLVREGWRGATFRDVVLAGPIGRTLVVTFDDAFRSVIDLAYPVLSGLGLPATVFAPTSFMSHRQTLVWPGIEHWGTTAPSELEGMSWDDLGLLAEVGWEIGSHTRTHPHLSTLDDAALHAELADSRTEVACQLDRACDTVAYPYGDVDERVAAAASFAGYAGGVALSPSLYNPGPHRWPRVGIYHPDDWWRFRAKVNRSSRLLRASSLLRSEAKSSV